ncbi:outer membrane protein [Tabrizicola sp.]|uniref:outer membrane protein n=1 Tax=Tabrizicola sp. TaxID=2005166 RepID=UPI0035B4178A
MKQTARLLFLLCLATPAAAQDWSGFYAGGALSYDSISPNDLSYGDGPVDVNGAGLGLFAGYNFQSGNLVYGAELAATKHSGESDDGNYLRPATALHSLALRGRIGFVSGKMLPYLAVGATRTSWQANHAGSGLDADVWDDTATGTSIALGLDWSLSERSFVRFEIERTNYGEDQIDFYNGDIHNYEMDATHISVGYAMRF